MNGDIQIYKDENLNLEIQSSELLETIITKPSLLSISTTIYLGKGLKELSGLTGQDMKVQFISYVFRFDQEHMKINKEYVYEGKIYLYAEPSSIFSILLNINKVLKID